MAPDRPAASLLHRRFGDFDEFAETIRGWNLEFSQLDAGPFDGELAQLATGSVQFAHARFGRVLDQRGMPPEGLRTLVVPADARQQFVWRGRDVSGADLLVFPEGGELEAASQPGFEVFTISLAEAPLAEAAAMLELPDPREWLHGREVFRCAPEAMRRMRRDLNGIVRELARRSERLDRRDVQEDLACRLSEGLLSTMASGRGDVSVPSRTPRKGVIDAADDIIRATPDEPLTVRGLCQAVGVSERTLRRAFLDRFGVPPKPYLRALRLNGVRRELRGADAATTKVADVANGWGFWHMGQFAADYRRLFGELPSATLWGTVGRRDGRGDSK